MTTAMPSPHHHNRYSDSNIHTMETVYGKGFLSPGGAEEVAQVVAPFAVNGAKVLDVGCGLGGASIALVRDHRAAHVTGVDIEPAVLARAKSLVAESGLSERVTLREVPPGALPFEDERFDLVYATAVTCHIEDLPPFFAEMRRVLRPGGHFTGGEWFIGRNTAAFSQWDDMLRAKGLNFYFVTWERYREALEAAGFEAPDFKERTDAVSALCTRVLEQVRGELSPGASVHPRNGRLRGIRELVRVSGRGGRQGRCPLPALSSTQPRTRERLTRKCDRPSRSNSRPWALRECRPTFVLGFQGSSVA